jgi:hypothetical protein
VCSNESFAERPPDGGQSQGKRLKSMAMMGSGSAPYAVDRELILLWYAYASGHYLQQATAGRLHPLDQLSLRHYDTDDFRQAAAWKLSPEYPNLPQWILTSNYVRFPRQFLPSVLPLRQPNTNGVFRATAFTNAHGLTVPSLATAEVHALIYPGHFLPMLVETFDIRATELRRHEGPVDFRPALPCPASLHDVRDLRTAVAGSSRPVLTNGWPAQAALNAGYWK